MRVLSYEEKQEVWEKMTHLYVEYQALPTKNLKGQLASLWNQYTKEDKVDIRQNLSLQALENAQFLKSLEKEE